MPPPTTTYNHPPPFTNTHHQPKYIHHHQPHSKLYPSKMFYTDDHNTNDHQTWQGGHIQWGASPIKSHYLLITWSSDFDFSHTICRFRANTPKSSPTSCFTLLIDYDNTKFGNTNYEWVLERKISWSWISMSTKSPHQMIQNN